MDDDSAKSGSRLDVSISFGRFENDALSWEKWSSFSPNKYLEEVGSLSTPGSVAQKKAYFEAHYKKIAARKAEELEQEQEQEQSLNPVFPIQDMSSKEDHTANASADGIQLSLSSSEMKMMEEACVTALTNVVTADEEKDGSAKSEEEMGASVAVEPGSSAVQESTCVSEVHFHGPELNVTKNALNAVLETPPMDSQRILKVPPESGKGLKQSSALRKENSKSNSRNMPEKVTPINKERSLSGTRKKVVSSPAKPLPATTPKHAKLTSISTPVSASQSLKKKVTNSAPPKIKSSQVVLSKRVAPTSLHMSLSLGRGDPLGALPVTRKSLIMESMGDKDIVKRAFKTFQNRTNGFATKEKPTTVKHVSTVSCEPKTSNDHTPTKGNEGLGKDDEKRATQRSQSGTRSNPLPSGLRKSIAFNRKTPTTVTRATGLRNDEKAEKRKELVKKLGAKSIAREAEKAQIGVDPKPKVGVQNEIRQLKQ